MKKFDFVQMGNAPQYRSAPFWAWNSELDPAEIRRQVRIMHDMHMGGFFMHSRAGLATEYLGKKWFECVHAAIDEAEKLNMHAGLYDEDRWPSGAAGGIVTKDKRFRMRYLEEYSMDSPIPGEAADCTLLNIFALQLDENGQTVAYRKSFAGENLPENWVQKKYVARIAHDQSTYNNAAYLDTTNAEAVQAFIDSTYEKYYQECGDKFGKSVQYFFCDEPNYLDAPTPHRRPWSDRLPELFSNEYDCDLLDSLPELFHNCGKKFSTVRYGFYRIMTRLFADTFMKMIGDWCQQHNINLTGHVLLEDSLSRQIEAVGAAMPSYEYMQVPGIDVLTAQWMVINTAKQVASVAHQLGKKIVLSELYGCTGWDFPLYGQKAWAEWQYALGVNLRCQHLAWYSMQGDAKRDYPASISGQSPWFGIYSNLEDYFARLGEVLDQTVEQPPLLVIHPIETMWGYAASYSREQPFEAAYEQRFSKLAARLLGNQLAFDYGDESLIAKYGEVSNGNFRIAQGAYQHILIPSVDTLRSSTAKLLEKFIADDGKVSYLGEIPRHLDGKPGHQEYLEKLYSSFRRLSDSDFAEVLQSECAACSIRHADGSRVCNVLVRSGVFANNCRLLYAVNTGFDLAGHLDAPWLEERTMPGKNLQFSLTAEAGQAAVKLDLFSGKLTPLKFEYCCNAYCWQDDIPPQDSCCYIIAPADALPEISALPDTQYTRECRLQELPAQLSEKNVLVLDHARAFDGSEKIADHTYVLDIDHLLRKRHQITLRGSQQLQPWFRSHNTQSFPAALEFEFGCEYLPENDLELIMENPQHNKIILNGHRLSSQSCGFWCDPALQILPLPVSALIKGKNLLRLEFDYNENTSGVESIYIAGDIAVKTPDIITPPAPVSSGQSVTAQGLPYYSGNIVYRYEFELDQCRCCQARLGEWHGGAVAMRWDSGAWQTFFALPGSENISAQLPAGKHVLEVTVYGHRRNVFGPFYCRNRSCWIGPHEFSVTERPDKELVPLGLISPPKVYC